MAQNEAELLAELTRLIAKIPRADHPYWAATAVRDAMPDAAVLDSGTAARIDSLWAGLQDWYELKDGDEAAALAAIRAAAVEWPGVGDDEEQRDRYFDRWTAAIRRASTRPTKTAGPPTGLGRQQGIATAFDESRGIGFIAPTTAGPTYAFRYDEIEIEAVFKTLEPRTAVDFDAYVSHAGERYARGVVPRS